MTGSKLQIPIGMQDTLPGECRAKRHLEGELRKLFSLNGYQEIETPILEYYGVLDDRIYGFRPEHIWKTFDRSGRILAVRPDSTIPAARLAAGQLREEPLPLRLYYLQSATEYERDTLSMLCENPQAGVELMGETCAESDTEVIALAMDALKQAGLKDFQIELGHAGFFAGLMAEAGLDENQTEEVRRLVEQKNALGIQLYLNKLAVPEELTRRLMLLPRMYGDAEVLDEAAKISSNPRCAEAIGQLRAILSLLKRLAEDAEVTIDLGLAQEAGYYSGIIFRGQVAGIGQPILSGGRYDGLTARFGRPLPAVGFALSIKTLLIALEQQGTVFEAPRPGCVISVESGTFVQAQRLAQAKRALGISTAMVYHMDEAGLKSYLRKTGADEGWIVTPEGETAVKGGLEDV
ncbi:MAG: ATP phosphoribosyltransferase regulatory subunit [Clostridia bacterium]|nr:ATP phosphoribosyltransferase regulatory subunit [Clostridia bacterium]